MRKKTYEDKNMKVLRRRRRRRRRRRKRRKRKRRRRGLLHLSNTS
jgi:hypothetical protein